MMKPVISIIVTAHDRKEFLAEALMSIVKQTGNPSSYQVLVVKNFEDPGCDRIIEENEFIGLKCGGSLADKILIAINFCDGEIIAFLEDDDLYANMRIARILEVFNKHHEISFYRNALNEIDQFGKKTGKNHHPQTRKSMLLRQDQIETVLPYLLANNVDFCTGCMAIRKSILVQNLDLFKSYTRLSSKFTDSLYFLFALKSKMSVFIDSSPFTYVRRHNSTSVRISGDIQESSAFRVEFTREFLNLYRYIQKREDLNHICSKYVSMKLTRAELEYYINTSQNRIGIFWAFKCFFKLVLRPHGRYEIFLSVCSLMALASPNLGRLIFSKILGF